MPTKTVEAHVHELDKPIQSILEGLLGDLETVSFCYASRTTGTGFMSVEVSSVIVVTASEIIKIKPSDKYIVFDTMFLSEVFGFHGAVEPPYPPKILIISSSGHSGIEFEFENDEMRYQFTRRLKQNILSLQSQK